MRKQKWKWVLISVVCFMLSTLTTMAADERLGTIVDGFSIDGSRRSNRVL